jgi:ribosomal protein S27AE
MSEFVKGQCPLCGSGVFVGSCGWLTCSGSECPDPLFVGEIFEKYKESNSNLGELMRIVKQLEAMTVPAPRLECPTNHTCMDNYDENGDITTILWSDESIDYAFCPDCGTSLAPPVDQPKEN